MKDKKTLIVICAALVVAVLCIIGLVVINNEDDTTDIADKTDNSETVGANCTIVECMKKLKATNTREEVSEVLGFEPKVDAMIGSDPIWKFDAKNWISYKTYGEENGTTIQATIDKEKLKDENIKLPSSTDLKKDLDNGSFTYEELAKKVGGEGTLTSIAKGSRSYTWVDKNGQKLGATFNNESGKCTVASYR